MVDRRPGLQDTQAPIFFALNYRSPTYGEGQSHLHMAKSLYNSRSKKILFSPGIIDLKGTVDPR